MSSWYLSLKFASRQELNRRLKSIIRENSFFKKLFEEFSVPISKIDDNLTFQEKKLDGRYAQGNGEVIYINKRLLEEDGFFDDKIHLIVHELVHWLTRQREKSFYFTDPEEIDAFMYGMSYELLRGKKLKEVEQIFYPIISAHFDDKNNAKEAYKAFIRGAIEKANKYK